LPFHVEGTADERICLSICDERGVKVEGSERNFFWGSLSLRATNQNIETMYYHVAVTKGEHRKTAMLEAYPSIY